MNIGLHGSYFGRNFGDTLILSIICEWIYEYNSNLNITLPFVSSELESNEILGGRVNNNNPFHELKGFIFGPGGYFGEPPHNLIKKIYWTKRNYKRHLSWVDKLYANNIPYMIIGVGVGPITCFMFRKKVIKLFKGAEIVSVRDEISKQYLIKWGVERSDIYVNSDVALTLSSRKQKIDVNNNKFNVALHLPGIKNNDLDKLTIVYDFLTNIIDYNTITLIEDSKDQYNSNSNSIYTFLIEKGIKLNLIKYQNPEQLVRSINSIDTIITTKLHVGIVAYALGKKVISLAIHTKTKRFYEQINLSRFTIPISDLTLNWLMSVFNDLESIDNSNNTAYKNSERNKELLYQYLDFIYN